MCGSCLNKCISVALGPPKQKFLAPPLALVSGFAKNLLTLFLEEGGIVNPEDVMRLAIAGGEYKELVVYD